MGSHSHYVLGFALVVLAAAGCQTPPPCDRCSVSADVAHRFGQSVGPAPPLDQVLIPPGLQLGQPLAEDQAVLLALWNNAAFQDLLLDLQLTKADLVTAGLLPNPEVVYYWPAPDKPLKYLVDFPIEAFWLRPIRLRIAAAENDRACARLTQSALDLIRDTRQAYADLQLAHDRVRVAEESLKLRARIAELAEARVKVGEASVQEASTAKIDALQARQEATRAAYDVPAAEERLKFLTGLPGFAAPFVLPAGEAPTAAVPDADSLVAEAIWSRPDAQAANHFARAATERARFARRSWVRFLGILDATSGRASGHEFGPALRMTLPLFNWNQGGIARADAEAEQADRRRLAVQNQIILDIRMAHTRYRQAAAELEGLRTRVRPEVELAVHRAEKAYEDKNISYLLVLEASRQLIDSYGREALLKADLRRAKAELERSVGRRLDPEGADRPK